MSSRSFEICGEIVDRRCNLADVGTGNLLVDEGKNKKPTLEIVIGMSRSIIGVVKQS